MSQMFPHHHFVDITEMVVNTGILAIFNAAPNGSLSRLAGNALKWAHPP